MADLIVPQLHLKPFVRQQDSVSKEIWPRRWTKTNINEVQTLTESCPGSTRGRSRSVPGLVGDITDIEGRSIFCDSNELEPAEMWGADLFFYCSKKDILKQVQRRSSYFDTYWILEEGGGTLGFLGCLCRKHSTHFAQDYCSWWILNLDTNPFG